MVKKERVIRYQIGRRGNGATYLVKLENDQITEASVISNNDYTELRTMNLQVAAGTLTAGFVMDKVRTLPLGKRAARSMPNGDVISYERLTTK